MKTLGIVAEYNPFHLGHKYLIEEAKKNTQADRVIVVMSGNSVQRGDFAVVDKFARAKEAVLNGADLVVELPFCFSSQSAEYFAKGAIYILNAIGIDYLCFGSENVNIQNQKDIADILLNEEKNIIKEMKSLNNENVASKRDKVLKSLFGNRADFTHMKSPNYILAIEYIKSIYSFGYEIEPIAIRRKGNNYHDKNIAENFSSATSIRKLLKNKDIKEELKISTTENMAEYLLNNIENVNSLDKYFEELKAVIIRDENLAEIFEIKEGIENLIKKSILSANSLENLILSIKSKRYTYTRIRRILLNILVGLKKVDMVDILKFEDKLYSRVLAFNDRGRNILKEIKKAKQSEDNILECNRCELTKRTEKVTDVKKKIKNLNMQKNIASTLNVEFINKLADFEPENEVQSLIYKYDSIVNRLYYGKYHIKNRGNRVYTDEQLSPIYIED